MQKKIKTKERYCVMVLAHMSVSNGNVLVACYCQWWQNPLTLLTEMVHYFEIHTPKPYIFLFLVTKDHL